MTARRPPLGLLAALPLLACPHCGGSVELIGPGVVGCVDQHRFDVARQGYLSLLGSTSRTDTADSADMVAARVEFLGSGHYEPIARAVAELSGNGPVLEIGAGTGYYLGAVLDRLAAAAGAADPADPVGLALDASGYAARRAAAHPLIGSVVADAWSRLPVRTAAVSTVLSVFAPRGVAEIIRVLAADGRVVVVTPEPEHLAEIRGVLGMLTVDPGKPDRLVQAFDGSLVLAARRPVRSELALSRADISALVRMGPSARHLPADDLAAAVDRLADRTTVTMSVTVSVFRADHRPPRG